MSDEPIPPVVQGDWVARSAGGDFEVARVRQAYYDNGKVYCDLVPYNLDGENIGRQSPPCGGPKAFEPWCQYTDNGWQRIERPEFPLKRQTVYHPVEGEPGRTRLELSIFHKGTGSAKPKAERTKPRKQSSDYPRAKVRIVQVPGLPSNAPEVEAAALRRAAQELRDQHRDLKRTVGADKIGFMIIRAEQLEAEAARLAG